MRASLDLFWLSGRGSTTTTKLFLFIDHGLDSIVHILNEINFGKTESPLVGDVVDVVSRLGVLSVDASDLDIETVGNSLEFGLLDSELGQFDVNRGSKCGTQVSGA